MIANSGKTFMMGIAEELCPGPIRVHKFPFVDDMS